LFSAALHEKEALRALRRGSTGAANVAWLAELPRCALERAYEVLGSAVWSAATEAILQLGDCVITLVIVALVF
jgi:hypothetical protein